MFSGVPKKASSETAETARNARKPPIFGANSTAQFHEVAEKSSLFVSRGTISKLRTPYTRQNNMPAVQIDRIEVIGSDFCFERAAKYHCVSGILYPVDEHSKEYFTPPLTDMIADLAACSPTVKLISDLLEFSAPLNQIHFIEYGQLKRIFTPDPSAQPYVSTYERERKIYCIMMDGQHHEILSPGFWHRNFHLYCHVPGFMDRDDVYVKYSVHHAGLIPKDDPRFGGADVMITVGAYNSLTRSFVAFKENAKNACYSFNSKHREKIFFQFLRGFRVWPRRGGGDDDLDRQSESAGSNVPAADRDVRRKSSAELVEHEGRMCIDQKGTMISVCNFVLHSVKSTCVYETGCEEIAPSIVVVARFVTEHGGRSEVYLDLAEKNRSPDLTDVCWVDVEVNVVFGELKQKSDVRQLFNKAYVHLLASNLDAGMLSEWISNQPTAPTQRCITRFGRQKDDVFVAANVCFKEGQYLSHREAQYTINPAYFMKLSHPLTPKEYPRNLVIPQRHVRYDVALRFWNHYLPNFFLNNEFPARAVICMFVMSLYSSKIWKGDAGTTHFMPWAYCYSSESQTGKTESILAGNAMIGFMQRALWHGDSSKAVLFDRVEQQADLLVAIDEVVIDKRRPDTKKMSDFGRALSDRSARAVTNKVRVPHSPAIFTVCP